MKNDRKYELILYPDAENYNCNDVLLKAQQYFDLWAYILHDKDISDDGSPKKAHYHLYGKSHKMLTPAGVSYHLGIPETSLSNIKNWKSAIRYLIHSDNPEKYPYDSSLISSNFDTNSILKGSEDDDQQAARIFEYIIDNPDKTLKEVTSWVINNNMWSGFRRGFAVWSQLIGGVNNENRRYSSR